MITETTCTENPYYRSNMVILIGEITKPPVFSHEIYGEKYYAAEASVSRLSGKADFIPLTVSEKLLEKKDLQRGTYVKLIGQYRSYNNYSGIGSRLVLTVFVKELEILDRGEFLFQSSTENPNLVRLNGYICKNPTYRTTPSNREISDILLAVNRVFSGKSDYIPCIAWGNNAGYAEKLPVGTNLLINGRIQSREYQKHINDSEIINRTAYEVSISMLEVI